MNFDLLKQRVISLFAIIFAIFTFIYTGEFIPLMLIPLCSISLFATETW